MGIAERTLKRLFPPGRAWWLPGNLALLVEGLAVSLETVRAFLRAVLAESVPWTAEAMLAEWHEALGVRYDPTQSVAFMQRMLDAIWTALGSSTLNALNAQIHKEMPLYEAEVDMCDRGDCESATPPMVSGETVPVTSDATWARDAGWAFSGSYSYKFTKISAAGTDARIDLTDSENINDMHGFLPGQTVTWRFQLHTEAALLGSKVYIYIFDYADGAWQPTGSQGLAIYDQEITVTRTLRSNCTGIKVRIYVTTTAALNEYFNVDEIEILTLNTFGVLVQEIETAGPSSICGEAECGADECASIITGGEINQYQYLVSGTVQDDAEAARVASVLAHFAPLHLIAQSSLVILTDTGTTEAGLDTCGIAECGYAP